METITNAVNSVSTTVSNAIYGTGNETGGAEPVSGVKGAGTASDPYDRGNDAALNPSTSAHTNPTTASSTTTSATTPSTTTTTTTDPSTSEKTTDTSTTATPSTSSTDPSTSGHSTATSAPHVTGPGPEGQERPSAGSRSGDIRPTEANENRPNTNAGGFGTAEPSVSADPSSGQKPQQKQQGGDRPLDEPTGEQVQAVKQEKKEGEAAQEGKTTSTSEAGGLGEERDGQRHPRNDEEREKMAEKGQLPKDPNDHSGEPMKMHDGSEENVAEKKTDKEGEGGETDRKKSVGQEGGQPHGSAKGTGEEWVKTSGFDAEGGDFDATKPGAGKEATRLLEEKGIHRENGDSANDAHIERSGDSGSGSAPKKTGTISKLKDKLHLGTGKNLDN